MLIQNMNKPRRGSSKFLKDKLPQKIAEVDEIQGTSEPRG